MPEFSFFQYYNELDNSEKRFPVNFFFGFNEFLGELLLEKLSQSFLEERTDFNFKRYYFDSEENRSLPELIEEARSASFFIQSRKILVAVIRDQKRLFSSKEDLDLFGKYLEKPNDDTIMVIYLSLNFTPDDFRTLRKSKINKIINHFPSDRMNLVDMDKIYDREIIEFIKKYLNERNINISISALDRVAEIMGEDLVTIMYQLNKLEIAGAGKGNIDSGDVEEIISGTGSHSIWELSEAIERKDSDSYLKILNYLFLNGIKPAIITGTLISHYNKIFIAKHMIKKNFPADEIGRVLSQPRFLLQKFMGQARNFSGSRLEKIGKLIYNLDYESKTGGEQTAKILLQNFIFQI